ncbi:MAG: hypothetical protein MOGDAGHF_00027 [Rhodocyclaceae bacterium]|nr:hypothetical protein [Rhodocyclaceae bacterium]
MWAMASSTPATTFTAMMAARYSSYQSCSVASLSFAASMPAPRRSVSDSAQPRSSTPLPASIAPSFGNNVLATPRATSSDSAVLQVPRRCVLAFSTMRSALSASAASSTYTWQLPSRCLMTGMRASFEMRSMRPLPPRGTMTSTNSFMVTSSPTAARSVVSTTCTAAAGRPASRRPS